MVICEIRHSFPDNLIFLLQWVASFGCPSIITCDRGRHFMSNLWHLLCEYLGCKLSHTCAYHPAANDKCERFNKQLKTFVKTHANDDWTFIFPGFCWEFDLH